MSRKDWNASKPSTVTVRSATCTAKQDNSVMPSRQLPKNQRLESCSMKADRLLVRTRMLGGVGSAGEKPALTRLDGICLHDTWETAHD